MREYPRADRSRCEPSTAAAAERRSRRCRSRQPPTPDAAAAAEQRRAAVKDIDDTKAPLLDHLIELRRRLLWCVAALLVACSSPASISPSRSSRVLVQPLLAAGQGKLIYTDVFEAFFVEVKVALFAALMISFPVFATQIWRFVAPGLYAKEKKAFLPFLLLTPFFFAGGAAFAYYRRHAVGAALPARLPGRCRRRQPGSASRRRQLSDLRAPASCSASGSPSCCRSC